MMISKFKSLFQIAGSALAGLRSDGPKAAATKADELVPGMALTSATSELAATMAVASDVEVLETLLEGAAAAAGRALASRLLRRFRTLGAAIAAPEKDLLAVAGVDKRAVARLRAVQETMLRMLDGPSHYRIKLSALPHVLDWLTIRIGHEPRNVFMAVFLDRDKRLLADEEVQGDLREGIVTYPKMIIRRALELDARYIILVRNEPAGHRTTAYFNPEVSNSDMWVAHQTDSAAEPLNMGVLDYIIVSPTGWISCWQNGYFSHAPPSSNNMD